MNRTAMPLRRATATLALWLVLPVLVFAQAPKLVEKFTPKPGELGIPYERYELANGLTVLIHEDHSDPIAYVDVTYHVGSAREEIGKSGFAHFFEHMMFQGSDHVADEEHFKIVTAAGGTLNGSTNFDRTNYYQTVPNNQVELMLWLEADRMGFLLDAVTQQKFEVQRATVKNERGQRYDNAPYGLVFETMLRTVYPYGHPYSWSTIGYLEDLDRADLQDLKNFFLRWYGPNNAVVTVAGDVQPKQVLQWVQKYFGSIPKGPAVDKMTLPVFHLDSDRYTYYEDNIQFPMVVMTWPTVPSGHKDEAALDLLAQVIGQGKSSLLYSSLVKSGKAVQAAAAHPAFELSGLWYAQVLCLPSLSMPDAEQAIRKALADFEAAGGVTDAQLANFKTEREADIIQSLSSVQAKGATMASNFTYFQDPDRTQKELQELRSLTKDDIMRVYNQYIKGKGAVVLSVVPKGKADIAAKAAKPFAPDSSRNPYPKIDYTGLTYTKAKDNFDRGQKPGPGANPTVRVPKFWTEKFPNGITTIGAENNEIPTFSVLVQLEGGRLQELGMLGKRGIASLTSSVLNEGTQKYTAAELADKLRSLGASISWGNGDETYTFRIDGLVRNLDATMELAQEVFFHPRFDPADFERIKKQQLAGIRNQATQPVTIANNVFDRLVYGDYAVSALGTEETVSAITLDDVKAFYEKQYAPAGATVTVVGAVKQSDIAPKLAWLKNWTKAAPKRETMPAAPNIDKTRIYLVDKPGAAQSEIRVGSLGIPFDATGDYYRFSLANYPLGGAFNSRINLLMREEKGWTYGARGGMFSGKLPGTYTASAGVLKTATDSAVAAFVQLIDTYRKSGVTADEIEFMKKSVGQREALRYESNFQKASFLSQIPRYNLPADFVDQQNKILANINKSEIDALAKKYLNPDKMVIVVVGDKATVGEGLRKLGYEVVELDAEGKRLAEK